MRYVTLDLEAPIVSFGSEQIDGLGRSGEFPRLSALAGLIGNALGYDRTEVDRLQSLQDRMKFAAALIRGGDHRIDFQTARLSKKDRAWTKSGIQERDGGADTYNSPIIRERHFYADAWVCVVLTLTTGAEPSIEEVAQALEHPARPIFVGRKPNIPSAPILRCLGEAADLVDALHEQIPVGTYRTIFPSDVSAEKTDFIERTNDVRDFKAGVHAGSRLVRKRMIEKTAGAEIRND